jgi:nitroreductase
MSLFKGVLVDIYAIFYFYRTAMIKNQGFVISYFVIFSYLCKIIKIVTLNSKLNMTSFYDLVKNRRSIRKYEDRAVEQEKIDSILRSALMSPASKRTNGWEFIVVDDRELLQKMSTCRELGSKFVADAPMAIVVCASPEKSDVWFEDASIAALIIQLAAQDLDLGSCWVQVYNRMHTETETAGEYIRGLLNIPENLEVLNIVTLGYKNEERKPYDEEKLSYDKLHRNTF